MFVYLQPKHITNDSILKQFELFNLKVYYRLLILFPFQSQAVMTHAHTAHCHCCACNHGFNKNPVKG